MPVSLSKNHLRLKPTFGFIGKKANLVTLAFYFLSLGVLIVENNFTIGNIVHGANNFYFSIIFHFC